MFRHVLTCPTYHYIGTAAPAAVAHLAVSTSPADFEAHLDHFETAYDIVDLDMLLHRPWPRRPLLLTFDDSYRTMADVVAPILKRRGLPGIVFLNPDMITKSRAQFDHVLSALAVQHGEQRVLQTLGPDAQGIDSVQRYLMGPATQHTPAMRNAIQAQVLAQWLPHSDSGRAFHTELELYLRPADIPTLTAAGLEIANHTASHVRCRAMARADLDAEIVGSKHDLEALSGRPVRAFSLPYGSRHDLTRDVHAVLSDSGHEVIFLADGRLSDFGHQQVKVWDRVPMDGVPAAQVRFAAQVRPRLRRAVDMARGWSRALSPRASSLRSTAPRAA